jgi:hypothetical protein
LANFRRLIVGDRADKIWLNGIVAHMPDFCFQISDNENSPISSARIDFPDEAAARGEGAAMLADFARNIAANLLTSPKWQLDAADEAIFRITVHAEFLGRVAKSVVI